MDEKLKHIPVLYKETIDILDISNKKQNIIVDCTLWLGWHALGVINRLNKNDIFVWIDADIQNLNEAKKNIQIQIGDKIEKDNISIYYINSNFENIKEEIENIWLKWITWIYYDFGVNSVHYDIADSGFSFRFDWSLDMRFDKSKWKTAQEIINNYSDIDLKRIFWKYWEEPKTVFIVNEILKRRNLKPIQTTFELLDIIQKSSYDPKSKTRVFQAIRMEVNNELSVIERSLESAIQILDLWWIIACITFHSLEDRLVKQTFKGFCENTINEYTWQIAKEWMATKINKKPIIPTEIEIKDNPRSRSAKLRAIEKINNS